MRFLPLVCALSVFSGLSPATRAVTHETRPSNETASRDLVGSWTLQIDPAEKTLLSGAFTFGRDGRFVSSAVAKIADKSVRVDVEGVWKIADGILIEEIKKSSKPDLVPVGQVTKDTIVRLDHNTLECRSAEGATERYQRKYD